MMYMRLKNLDQFIGIITLFIILPINSQELINCNNTIGGSGQCISIYQCETIFNSVRIHGSITKTFLRRFYCGSDNGEIKVCCPIESELQYELLFAPYCGLSTKYNSKTTNDGAPISDGTSFDESNPIVGISNGDPAKLGAWPWIAALGYQSNKNPNKINWRCGGSLITHRHILTAAHCIQTPQLKKIRLGDLNLYSDDDGANPIDFNIEKFDIHPDYDPIRHIHDIAIIKLDKNVVFSDFIRPICLPLLDDLFDNDYQGYSPFVIGWGRLGPGRESAAHLQEVQVPVVNQQDCRDAFKSTRATIDDNVICAGYPQGERDACEGDSGGPLFLPVDNFFYEIGVVSYGIGCAHPNIPGVYATVSRHIDFIISHLN